ncbi:MAG TPA: pyridoxamine 5'-phosphate oxidase family protein [Croceibacterium sp.]|nr:pyridoxamine 5'-phosphate oxidase family protein [Croceibacterium sp.]
MTDTDRLKQKFWTELADSPFLFLQLDADPHAAVPMTAQLDRQAHGTIWFFTSRTGPFAPGGAATATFSSKGHDLFARFSGTLSEETNQSRLEEEWSPAIEAWFPGGKNDPDLLMLRMDLNQAEIWNANLGFIDTAKMLLGFDVRQDAEDDHTRTSLS